MDLELRFESKFSQSTNDFPNVNEKQRNPNNKRSRSVEAEIFLH